MLFLCLHVIHATPAEYSLCKKWCRANCLTVSLSCPASSKVRNRWRWRWRWRWRSVCKILSHVESLSVLTIELFMLSVQWSNVPCCPLIRYIVSVCHFTGHLSNPLLDSFAWPGLLTLALYALYWRLHSLKSWWQSAHDKTSIISFEGCKHPSTQSSSSWPPIASPFFGLRLAVWLSSFVEIWQALFVCVSPFGSRPEFGSYFFYCLPSSPLNNFLLFHSLSLSLCPHHVFSGCIHMSLFAGKTLVVRARIRLQSF